MNRGLYGRHRHRLRGRLKNGANHVSNDGEFEPVAKSYEETRKETADLIKRIMGKENENNRS